MSAAHRANPTFRPQNMARPNNGARPNANLARGANTMQPRANTATSRNTNNLARNTSGTARANGTVARNSNAAGTTAANRNNLASTTGTTGTVAGVSPTTYRYGTGANGRNYQAHGYGRGYRNRYAGGRSGYGQSQGNVRGIVSRLRSVHSSLARLDHDYNGHRVQAMHHLNLAIRSLSHRSGTNNGIGANGVGNGNRIAAGGNAQMGNALGFNAGNNGNGNRNVAANGNDANRNNPRIPQAQSDARMSQALRTTQGIAMQMNHQGTNSAGLSRAHGHVQGAIAQMQTALAMR
jgi:hypothetical protein